MWTPISSCPIASFLLAQLLQFGLLTAGHSGADISGDDIIDSMLHHHMMPLTGVYLLIAHEHQTLLLVLCGLLSSADGIYGLRFMSLFHSDKTLWTCKEQSYD